MTQPAFTREQFKTLPAKLLRDGHAANACVWCVEHEGKAWTVKDFSTRGFFVRKFLAPFLLAHEITILKKLAGVQGIASECFKIDSEAIAIAFLPGSSLSRHENNVPAQYLEEMELLLKTVHAHGVVHLDTRGTGNWLVSPEGKPLLIDFQASLSTGWMPKRLRHILELVDLGGIYKKWQAWHPETMSEERIALLEEANHWRSKWKIRGYFGAHKSRS